MSQTKSQLAESLIKVAEAALIDAPLALTLKAFRRDADKEIYEAGWKAYDGAVAAATDVINRVYKAPATGRVVSRVTDRSLRVQRLADAARGAFFAVMWPTVGLPTSAEVRSLKAEIRALREEVRAARALEDVAAQVVPQADGATPEHHAERRPVNGTPTWFDFQPKVAPEVSCRVSAQ